MNQIQIQIALPMSQNRVSQVEAIEGMTAKDLDRATEIMKENKDNQIEEDGSKKDRVKNIMKGLICPILILLIQSGSSLSLNLLYYFKLLRIEILKLSRLENGEKYFGEPKTLNKIMFKTINHEIDITQ